MVTDVHNDIQEIYFTEEQIRARVAALGAQITADYRGKNPLLIGILKGSYIFLADLSRNIDMPCGIDFMLVSSYGNSAESSGEITIKKDVGQSVEGRDVLLVEDIQDSGITLHRLRALLEERGAHSIRICALLSKPARRKVETPIEYLGFEIEDKFVVGYGLDYAESYRNLPYIGILKPSVYNGENQ